MSSSDVTTPDTQVWVAGDTAPPAINEFRSAFYDAGVAIGTASIDGVLRSANRSLCQLVGFRESELVGTPLRNLIHVEELDGEDFPGRLLSGEVSSIHVQRRVRTKDHPEVWCDIKVGLFHEAEYSEPRLVISLVDITERKRAEEQFRLVVEAAPTSMIMVGSRGRIKLVNSQTEKLFGYKRDELLDQPVEMLVPERYRAGHANHRISYFGAASARPMGGGRDLYGIRKDGTEIPMEVGLNPISTAEGQFVLASIIDITERKKAEERFRMVVEAAPTSMIMVGSDGRIKLVNSQTEKLFGYQRDELLGEPVEMLVPERYHSIHSGHRTSFFAAPSARPMGGGRDLYGVRKDGTEIPMEVGLNPISTAEGHFVLASIIDITARKRAEAALKDAQADLEVRVQQRTSELAREIAERKSAEERIKASLREKEILLKEVHHRVKNNLAVIVSLLNRQAESTNDSGAIQALEESQRRVQAMALVHEYLYAHEYLDRVNFADYIQELANRLHRTLIVSPQRVKLRIQAETVALGVERAVPCGLILNELLTNTFKYAFPEERTGEVHVYLGESEPGWLMLSVHDNGIGMPEDFDWRKTKSLGLQIVQILAKQLRGTIELDRTSGTTFRLRFPGERN